MKDIDVISFIMVVVFTLACVAFQPPVTTDDIPYIQCGSDAECAEIHGGNGDPEPITYNE